MFNDPPLQSYVRKLGDERFSLQTVWSHRRHIHFENIVDNETGKAYNTLAIPELIRKIERLEEQLSGDTNE